MEHGGRLTFAVDTDALAAAIYFKSGVTESNVTSKNLCDFFDTTEEKISRILGE